MKRVTKSREFLATDCRVVEIEGKFFVDKPRAGLTELKPWTQAATHKYGKTLVYQYVCLFNYNLKKGVLMTYHSFLYAWYKGEVPAGYDVDHIDNDTLNNDLDNLQLLSHEENIKKRGGGKNQWTAAKERGITVDYSTYNRPKKYNTKPKQPKEKKIRSSTYKHSEQFIAKKIQSLENELAQVKAKEYTYEKVKPKTIKKLENQLKELKKQ